MGLNFSFEEEASRFQKAIRKAVNTLVKLNNKKLVSDNNNSDECHSITIKVPGVIQQQKSLTDSSLNVSSANTSMKKDSLNRFSFIDLNKKAEKKVIDKNTISDPIQNSFIHLNHIGLSTDNSFNVIIF